MSVTASVPDDDLVAPEIVSSVFYSAAVSDGMAVLVAETVGSSQRLSWGNAGALHLLGYGLTDLRSLPVEHLFPSLEGGELKLLLRRERSSRMTLPIRTASGAMIDAVVVATPSPGGRMWTIRVTATANEQDRALRATADAHERRFSALTERSPIPTLLSEQGMRLAHVNDAFCSLVGLRAEQLLGTGWIDTVHADDLDTVIEQVAAALEGGEVETQARLIRDDGTERTTVIRFAHLFTPGVGAGFVGTIEDITDRLAFEATLAHQANHDPLTGLPNRTLLAQYVSGRFVAGGSDLACLFLDLDNFKVVNDSLGHTAGDELLVEVADRLRATVRPGDLVARFGGDEFVVVCENVGEDDAVALAERVSVAAGPADAPGRGRHPPARQRRRHRPDRRARRGRGPDPGLRHRDVPGEGRWQGADHRAGPAGPCRGPGQAAPGRRAPRRHRPPRDHPALPADLRHQRPCRGRGRVAGPLAARRARRDQPGDLRAAGRGERSDRRTGAARAGRDLPSGGRVGPPAGCRRAAAGQRERLGPAARRQPARAGRRPPCAGTGWRRRGSRSRSPSRP